MQRDKRRDSTAISLSFGAQKLHASKWPNELTPKLFQQRSRYSQKTPKSVVELRERTYRADFFVRCSLQNYGEFIHLSEILN